MAWIDQQMQDELAAMIGRGALVELCQEQLEASRAHLPELARLAQVQDWDALQLACHRIKGSAANLGLSGLAEAAAQLEVAARSQDMLRMQVSLREIEARIAATGCALEGAAE